MKFLCPNGHETVLPNPRNPRQRWPDPEKFLCLTCKAPWVQHSGPYGTVVRSDGNEAR